MAIDFPASPSVNDTYTVNGVVYTWDGTKWTAVTPAGDKIVEGNTNAEVIDTGSNGRFVVTTEGTERLRVTDTGLVGIGSSSPSQRLTVAGNILTTSAAGTDSYVNVTTTGVQNTYLGFNNSGSTNSNSVLNNYSYVGAGNAYGLQLLANGTPVVTIDTSQRVGIGTTSPSSPINTGRLMVQGGDIVVRDDNVGNNWNRGTLVFDIRNSNGDSKSAYIQSNKVSDVSSTLQFFTTATHALSERMRIDDAGRLLVGTSSSSGNYLLEVNGAIKDSAGPVRSIPQNSQTSGYTLVASDTGKHISITTGGVTVPASIFSVGDVISIYNNSGSNQTITQGASTTLRQAGTANTGNRTLAQYGVATVLCVASNTFVISGAGLS